MLVKFVEDKYGITLGSLEKLKELGKHNLNGMSVGICDDIIKQWQIIGELKEYMLFPSSKRDEEQVGCIIERASTNIYQLSAGEGEQNTYEFLLNKAKASCSMLATMSTELEEMARDLPEKPMLFFLRPLSWFQKGDEVIFIPEQPISGFQQITGTICTEAKNYTSHIMIDTDQILAGRYQIGLGLDLYNLLHTWEVEYMDKHRDYTDLWKELTDQRYSYVKQQENKR